MPSYSLAETAVLLAGAAGWGGRAGVGAAVAVGLDDGRTLASVADLAQVSISGAVTVKAERHGATVTVAGAVGSSASGVGASGTFAVNRIDHVVSASLGNVRQSTGASDAGAVTVHSENDSTLVAVAGAVGRGGTGLGVALAMQDVAGGIYTALHSVSLKAASFAATAHNGLTLASAALGVGVATQPANGSAPRFAGAGSVALNLLDLDTLVDVGQSTVGAGTQLRASGDITLEALDDAKLIAVAGGVAASSSQASAVGAAIAFNRSNGTTRASIEAGAVNSGGTVDAQGALTLSAQAAPLMVAIAVGGAAAGPGSTLAAAGAVPINLYGGEVDAHVRKTTVASGTDLSVTATMAGSLIAASLAAATSSGGTALGAAVVVNMLGGNIDPDAPGVLTVTSGSSVTGMADADPDGSIKVTPHAGNDKARVWAYMEDAPATAGGQIQVSATTQTPLEGSRAARTVERIAANNAITVTPTVQTGGVLRHADFAAWNTGDQVVYTASSGSGKPLITASAKRTISAAPVEMSRKITLRTLP